MSDSIVLSYNVSFIFEAVHSLEKERFVSFCVSLPLFIFFTCLCPFLFLYTFFYLKKWTKKKKEDRLFRANRGSP